MLKIIPVLLLLLCATVSLHAQCDAHKDLKAKMQQALVDKNADLLAEVYHADAKRHVAGETLDGLAAIQEDAKNFYENIPDANTIDQDIICHGDKMVIRWLGKGTPKEFGKEVAVTGITIYRVKEGKIIEEWEELSMMALMMQMGFELVPPGEK